MAAPEPDGLGPAPLLERVAIEILHCRSILSRIEQSVHDILDHGPPGVATRSWQKNMQDIDLLEQNLGDLARCLHAAATDPATQAADGLNETRVLGHLRLDDLRQRLRGRTAQIGQAATVEFF